MSIYTTIGALSGASAVALGAFGSHGLKKHVTDPQLQATWQTAAYYHLIHSAIMAVTPLLIPQGKLPANRPIRSAQLFGFGILFFSGSLYALVLTNEKRLGAVAPIGGTALIGGWIALALRR